MGMAVGCLLAFLLGAIPFGLVLVRLFTGKDLRQLGSGNVGATNASRAFASRRVGLAVFVLIYLLDAAKGFAPTWFGPGWLGEDGAAAPVLLGASAILGHCFSPFLRFRGGKGVATTTGVLAALDVTVLAIGLLAFFAVLALTRRVFLSSLALGVALAAAAIGLQPQQAFAERLPITVLCLLLAVFLFYTHRSNLRKFLAKRSAEASS